MNASVEIEFRHPKSLEDQFDQNDHNNASSSPEGTQTVQNHAVRDQHSSLTAINSQSKSIHS